MNRKIRLTEGQLNKIIKESVKNVLSELDWRTYANASAKRPNTELDRAAEKAIKDKYGYSYPVEFDTHSNGQHISLKNRCDNRGRSCEPHGYKATRQEAYPQRLKDVSYDFMPKHSYKLDGFNYNDEMIGQEISDYIHDKNEYIKGKGWVKK